MPFTLIADRQRRRFDLGARSNHSDALFDAPPSQVAPNRYTESTFELRFGEPSSDLQLG